MLSTRRYESKTLTEDAVSVHTFTASDSSKINLLLSKTSNVELTETDIAFMKVNVFVALSSKTSMVTATSPVACVFVTCRPIRTHFELFPLGHVKIVVGLPELLLIFSAQAFLNVFAISLHHPSAIAKARASDSALFKTSVLIVVPN